MLPLYYLDYLGGSTLHNIKPASGPRVVVASQHTHNKAISRHILRAWGQFTSAPLA